MYNSDMPNTDQLPSSKQLLLSTLAAAVVAGVLLITVVLPAEYAIDPTGIGKTLGLAQMGEIKTSLAKEAEEDTPQPATSPVDKTTPAAVVKPTVSAPEVTKKSSEKLAPISLIPVAQTAASPVSSAQANTIQTSAAASTPPLVNPAQRVIKLIPGAAAELKLVMKKGTKVNYNWIASGGKINFDTHGDNATTNYYGYNKGRNVTGDNGQLTAAFDGSHGWFWRNRSGGDVTVTLEISGDYQVIKRVM